MWRRRAQGWDFIGARRAGVAGVCRGAGSDTKSLELGILRISGAAAADEEDARTIRTGLARRVVHPRVGARAQSIDGVTSLAHVSGPFVTLPENFDHFLTENFDRVRTMASLPIKRHVTGWDTVHGLKPRFNV